MASTPGAGQLKRSIPSARSPERSAWARAMKKRPWKVPISAAWPVTPNSDWMRMSPQQIAAENGPDIPSTSE